MQIAFKLCFTAFPQVDAQKAFKAFLSGSFLAVRSLFTSSVAIAGFLFGGKKAYFVALLHLLLCTA